MATLFFGCFVNDDAAVEKMNSIQKQNGLPHTWVCYSSFHSEYKKGMQFYSGMIFAEDVAEKYINEFNKLFKNIQMRIVSVEKMYQTRNSFSGTGYSKEKTEKSTNAEYVLFTIEYAKDVDGKELYANIVKYYLDMFLAETIRMYCLQYKFWEGEIESYYSSEEKLKSKTKGKDITENFFENAIKISNERNGQYGVISSTSGGIIQLDRVMWFDIPEKINKIFVEGKKLKAESDYFESNRVSFEYTPYPHQTVKLLNSIEE